MKRTHEQSNASDTSGVNADARLTDYIRIFLERTSGINPNTPLDRTNPNLLNGNNVGATAGSNGRRLIDLSNETQGNPAPSRNFHSKPSAALTEKAIENSSEDSNSFAINLVSDDDSDIDLNQLTIMFKKAMRLVKTKKPEKIKEARKIFTEIRFHKEMDDDRISTLYNIACCDALLGSLNSAFRLIRRCFQLTRHKAEAENRKVELEKFKTEISEDPDLKALIAMPEYTEMAERFITRAIRAVPTKNTNSKGKQSLMECYACLSEVPETEVGISCAAGHHLCSKCAQVWTDTLAAEQYQNLPPKCPVCKVDLGFAVVERAIKNPVKLLAFMSYSLAHQYGLRPDEAWVNCSKCNYRELRASSETPLFVYCKDKDCKKISCFTCHADVTESSKILESPNKVTKKAFKEAQAEWHRHLLCQARKYFLNPKFFRAGHLQEIETALSNSVVRTCPSGNCKTRGMKDDACTHMTCSTCAVRWCYVCGKSERDAPKAQRNGNIYSHNLDWDTREDRCPMYLHQVFEIDPRWPQDDEDAVLYFHRHLQFKALREIIAREGQKAIAGLVEDFPNCLGGYTLDAVLAFDLNAPLIRRDVDSADDYDDDDD